MWYKPRLVQLSPDLAGSVPVTACGPTTKVISHSSERNRSASDEPKSVRRSHPSPSSAGLRKNHKNVVETQHAVPASLVVFDLSIPSQSPGAH